MLEELKTEYQQRQPVPVNALISPVDRGVIERAVATAPGLFNPLLALLERLRSEAERLPARRCKALQATLDELFLRVLFDRDSFVTDLTDAIERQLAVEACGRLSRQEEEGNAT
jgi:hypothetical protein